MAERWRNWSGGLEFEPERYVRATNEAAVVEAVRAGPRPVRSVGSGHSSSPLVATPGTLVSLEPLDALHEVDAAAGEASIGAGAKLGEVGKLLAERGFAMENLGDVDTQAIAGAFGTGTHGSGERFPHLGDQLVGFRLVDGRGEVVDCHEDDDPETLRAARLSLGLLGVMTSVRLRVIPAGRYIRREWCVPIQDCLDAFERLVSGNRNFDFYWYPRRDEAKIRTHNPVGSDPGMTIPGDLETTQDGPLDALLVSKRDLKFHEMEYWLPYDDGLACFAAVRERIKAVHRRNVAWRVLVRVVAADDAYLSPGFERKSIAITIHQNQTLPHEEFFADIEPIFQRFDGRPHWAKVHSLEGERLRRLYPAFGEFEAVRRRFDPEGVFLNDYLRRTFGAAA